MIHCGLGVVGRRPERAVSPYPAYEEQVRSGEAVKHGDGGATAQLARSVLDRLVSEGRRGRSRNGADAGGLPAMFCSSTVGSRLDFPSNENSTYLIDIPH